MKIPIICFSILTGLYSLSANANVFINTDVVNQLVISKGTQIYGVIRDVTYIPEKDNKRSINLSLEIDTGSSNIGDCTFTPESKKYVPNRIMIVFNDDVTKDVNVGSTFFGLVGKKISVIAPVSLTLTGENPQVLISTSKIDF